MFSTKEQSLDAPVTELVFSAGLTFNRTTFTFTTPIVAGQMRCRNTIFIEDWDLHSFNCLNHVHIIKSSLSRYRCSHY